MAVAFSQGLLTVFELGNEGFGLSGMLPNEEMYGWGPTWTDETVGGGGQ